MVDHNQMVSSVRYAQERLNKNCFTSWKIIGGKLHWSHVPQQKYVIPVLAGVWNDELWKPENYPFQGKHDESDFEERKSKYDNPEIISKMLTLKLNFSTSVYDHSSLPQITLELARKFSAGTFAHKNAINYLKRTQKVKVIHLMECVQSFSLKDRRMIRKKVSVVKSATLPKKVRLPENWRLLKFQGIPSKMTKDDGRTAHVLFDMDTGTPIDYHCTCKGGLKSTGCGHCHTALMALGQDQNNIDKVLPNRSETHFNSIARDLPDPLDQYDEHGRTIRKPPKKKVKNTKLTPKSKTPKSSRGRQSKPPVRKNKRTRSAASK